MTIVKTQMCTTAIITRPNRVKELIMKYIIDESDGKTENHPYFQDLVSSLSVFNNQKKSDIELEEGDALPDDSDFTFIKDVEEYLKIWINNPTKEILVDCSVSEDWIWSSNSSHKDGYDRVKKIDYDACKRWVRTEENSKPKGYVSEDAGSGLSLSIRFYYDDEKVLHIVFVKNKGNHRFTMRKMVNPFKKLRMKSYVKFHSIQTKKDLHQHEANRHWTEAEENKGQGEKNKVTCAYVAKRPKIVYMMDWLGSHQVDYAGILAQSDDTAKKWVNIESVSGIDAGEGNGYFKKYGKECVEAALKITRDIANNITNEKSFKNSALKAHSIWYRTWTIKHKNKEGKYDKEIMRQDELTKWFKDAYKKKNANFLCGKDDPFSIEDEAEFKLKRLAMSGEVKDIPYIMANLYFDQSISLKSYYKKMKGLKNGVGFGAKSPSVLYYLNQTDRLLKDEVRKMIIDWD